VLIDLLGVPRVRLHDDGSAGEETAGPDPDPQAAEDAPARPRLAGRQPALLALLALDAPRPVTQDRIIDAMWGTQLPADPANALQQRISALRRVLDPARRGDVLVPVAGGYALHLDAERIDARCFTRLAATGHGQLQRGEARAASRTLSEALSLWRGPALDGYADEPWASAEVARLTELRLTAAEDRITARLQLGEGEELVPELTELVASNPLRERCIAQLLHALYRAGRQSEALLVYERTRERSAEELGVDPSPMLQRLHGRILAQDPALDAPAPLPTTSSPPAATAPLPEPSPTPEVTGPALTGGAGGNLPLELVPVIGRDEDLAELRIRLSESRLVTLTGSGGAGKTTLALALADSVEVPADGVWFVPLTTLPAGAEIVGTVATTLGLPGGGLGTPGLGAPSLASAIADRALLLVLDNAEHVVDAVAELAQELLLRAPRLQLLVTSREVLRVPGEQVVEVSALATPELGATDPAAIAASPAVELLVARARAHTPSFSIDRSTADAAARLVQQLDGIPLAIELAASRLRVLSLPELTGQLTRHLAGAVPGRPAAGRKGDTGSAAGPTEPSRSAAGVDRDEGLLELLSSRARGVPERQRSLRGALDWSWGLLDPELQRAWAALSVPPGRCSLPTAAELLTAAGVGGHHLDVLGELTDRSVVSIDTTTAPTWIAMLETVRAYGREQLAALGLTDAVAARHADLVERALAAAIHTDDPAAYSIDLDALAAWRDDARAAMSWADAAGDRRCIQRLAGQLGWSWTLHGLAGEGLAWLDRGLGAVDEVEAKVAAEGPTAVDPAALLWASGLRTARPDAQATRWAALSMQVADRPEAAVFAGVFAAAHHARSGEVATLVDLWADVEAQAVALGGWPLGFLRLIGAQLARMTGRLQEVGPQAEEAYTVLSSTGPGWAEAYAIDLVIEGVSDAGEHERARALATRGLQLCRAAGSPELEGRLLLQLGVAEHHLGARDVARDHVERAIGLIARASGFEPTAHLQGDGADDAVGVGVTSPPRADDRGPGPDGTSLGFAHLTAGVLARERGDPAAARSHLAAAATLLAASPTPYGRAWVATERCLTAAATGELEVARSHGAQAVALAREVGEPDLLRRAVAALEAANASTG